MGLTVAEKRELLALYEAKRALQARNSLDAFARMIEIPGVPMAEDSEEFFADNVEPAAHHQLVLGVLQKVESGEIPRAMFFMPPGSAKTTYASVVFPPWFMGRKPGRNVIATSYGSDLAKKFGRKCRSIVKSTPYQQIFGTTLAGGNTAVDDWSLANGSTYMSGGILSGITGNRSDLLLIDDPVKGREDADSETIREKTWEAYLSDLRSRMKPNGGIVVIQTRWNEDDLSGRILPDDYDGRSGWIEARDGEQWYIVNLPAQCEREDDPLGRKIGDWLWTDWFNVDFWEREKKTQSPRNWAALYQQRPAPEEGSYFLAEWIKYYDKPPPRDMLKVYGASDYAVSDGEGDWTVHLIVGVDHADNIYLLDMWREKSTTEKWVKAFCDLVLKWKPIEWAEEAGQIRRSMDPFIKKQQRERKAYVHRRQFPTVGDKEMRAQSIRGRMAMGNVLFPRSAPWIKDMIAELLTFPAGRHDDQVDTFGLIGRMLDRMGKGKTAPKPKEKPMGMEGLTLERLFSDRETEQRQRWF